MIRKVLVSLACWAIGTVVAAQDGWTLDRCIDHALEHNIAVLQSDLARQVAENDLRLAQWDIYSPTVNANLSYNFNFGNSLDPTTFQFVRQNTQSSSMSLNANYDLFRGTGRLQALQVAKADVQAASFDMERVRQETRINVTRLFLQVLVSNAVYQVAQEQKALTLDQEARTQELVDAGLLAQSDLAEVRARMADDEVAIVNARNGLEMALLQLRNALRIDPSEPFSVLEEPLDVSTIELRDPRVSPLEESWPGVEAAEWRLRSAESSLKQAKASFSPRLSLSSSINTNYFSAAVDFITGQEIPGGEQLNDNLAENIGFSLSIPILSKGQRLIALSNARIGIERARFELQNQTDQVRLEAVTAFTEARAARERYVASARQVDAAQVAFDFAREKLDAGLINAFEFTAARNRLTTARIDNARARYEYWFRAHILELYRTGSL